MRIQRAIRAIAAILTLTALAALAVACGKPAADATANPDADALKGRWLQFIPVDSMPEQLWLDPSGGAAVDDEAARWLLQGGLLVLRQGGNDRSFSYTVSGYMLTLFDMAGDASAFYINPDSFAAEASGNGKLAGEWAAFDSWGKLIFDGKRSLVSMVHTEGGDTRIDQSYAARDGILQAEDTAGNFSYNLYSESQDGALLLAETADYDNDVKQWTPYWKRAEPESGLLGHWNRVISSDAGNTAMPDVLELDAAGAGKAGAKGAMPVDFRWEYYNGGFLLMRIGSDHLYAWCGAEGGVLFVGNPDVDECWYVDQDRFHPTAQPLSALAGTWATEDGAVTLAVKGASFTLTSKEESNSFSALAADGLLKLAKGNAAYFAAYSLEDGELRLYGAGLPLIGQMEMPIVLVRRKS